MESIIADRSESYSFNAETAPDVYVTETFVNKYSTERAVLAGDTYDAKEIIKFDWETTHHKWNGQNWVVDADSLDELESRLENEGFSFSREIEQGPFYSLVQNINPDDRIIVHYQQKNGEGANIKEGIVLERIVNDDGPAVSFRRDDEQYMYFKFDENGLVALYTGMSHAPFVGHVTGVEVLE